MARTKQIGPRHSGPSLFTEKTLKQIAEDMKSGRMGPMTKTQISDDMVSGLRAAVQKSGLITYHVAYYVGDQRPFIAIGHASEDMDDYITVNQAREIAKTIKALGEMGIDVQDGLYKRLLREIQEQGTAWRPNKADRGKAAAGRR